MLISIESLKNTTEWLSTINQLWKLNIPFDINAMKRSCAKGGGLVEPVLKYTEHICHLIPKIWIEILVEMSQKLVAKQRSGDHSWPSSSWWTTTSRWWKRSLAQWEVGFCTLFPPENPKIPSFESMLIIINAHEIAMNMVFLLVIPLYPPFRLTCFAHFL